MPIACERSLKALNKDLANLKNEQGFMMESSD
jgi:hypothetical protein